MKQFHILLLVLAVVLLLFIVSTLYVYLYVEQFTDDGIFTETNEILNRLTEITNECTKNAIDDDPKKNYGALLNQKIRDYADELKKADPVWWAQIVDKFKKQAATPADITNIQVDNTNIQVDNTNTDAEATAVLMKEADGLATVLLVKELTKANEIRKYEIVLRNSWQTFDKRMKQYLGEKNNLDLEFCFETIANQAKLDAGPQGKIDLPSIPTKAAACATTLQNYFNVVAAGEKILNDSQGVRDTHKANQETARAKKAEYEAQIRKMEAEIELNKKKLELEINESDNRIKTMWADVAFKGVSVTLQAGVLGFEYWRQSKIFKQQDKVLNDLIKRNDNIDEINTSVIKGLATEGTQLRNYLPYGGLFENQGGNRFSKSGSGNLFGEWSDTATNVVSTVKNVARTFTSDPAPLDRENRKVRNGGVVKIRRRSPGRTATSINTNGEEDGGDGEGPL
jgi:hypothetical protein